MLQEPVSQPYTAPEWIMLISAIGALLTGVIAAVASAIVSVRTQVTVKQTSQQLRENTEITHATLTKTNVIEAHVNSERSKLDEQLASAQREKELLKVELAERNHVNATLAQRVPDPNAPHTRRSEDKKDEA